jgi:epoxide hydrolase 4
LTIDTTANNKGGMVVRILSLLMFALAPIPALAQTPAADPAVVHANNIKSGEMAYKEGYFGERDDRLHFVEAGEGPMVILYHGFPSFWYSWFDQMEALKTRYRVVAVDGLGAGLSAKPENVEAYRVKQLAAQLDTLARHLNGRKRFILIGHDWGAALAFAYAQAYPKRLNAVIGLSAPPYNLFLDLVRDNEEQQKRSQYMQLFRSVTLDDIRQRNIPTQIWQQSYGGLISRGDLSAKEGQLFRKALDDPYAINGGMNWYRANIPDFANAGPAFHWPVLHKKIRVPSLFIWGDNDKTFVEDFLTQLNAYAPEITIVRQQGVGHWTSMENPTATNDEINTFLNNRAKRTKRQ